MSERAVIVLEYELDFDEDPEALLRAWRQIAERIPVIAPGVKRRPIAHVAILGDAARVLAVFADAPDPGAPSSGDGGDA